MKRRRHKKSGGDAGAKLHHDDTAGVALHKLLLPELRSLDAIARRSADAEPTAKDIHDARIALRRSAALLRFFAEEFDATSAACVRRMLQDLSTELGKARDLTVWSKLVSKRKIARAMAEVPGWDAFLGEARRRGRPGRHAIRNLQIRPAWRDALASLRVLIRSELRQAAPEPGVANRVADAVRRRARRLLRLCDAETLSDTRKLHELRRRMRRLRYLAESFAPVLPRKLRKLAKKLHRAESRLGKVHDIDLALVRLRGDARPVAAALARVLAHRRAAQAARI